MVILEAYSGFVRVLDGETGRLQGKLERAAGRRPLLT
jgi:hypothetical protein